MSAVRFGRTYRLDAPHDPALTRFMQRIPSEHRIERIMGVAWDDIIDSFNTQGSTQWDGFGHFGHDRWGHYGGLSREEHGVEHWARRSFATRGVLADVARWREEQGRPFDAAGGEMLPADDLLLVLETQNTQIEPGDVLLIRFGWMQWWRSQDRKRSPLIQPGLEPSLRTCEVLWDLHIAAVGCDPSLDPIPGKWAQLQSLPTEEQTADPAFALSLSLHWLLPYLGLSIGEFFDLDDLAEDCAEDGTWDFLLTTAPMQLPGGVATPANAVAVR